MHIIITHTNADFDAIASLLAMRRLNPEAVPVLPNTLNRNVRDFITLYETHFPFIRLNELGRDPIERVTVVDTQQFASIKGVTGETPLHIVDHHELHRDLPQNATFTTAETGANVTPLVEEISHRALPLSSIEATLLLLGIYEDTGSLTYGNTSPRDLKAAAWLIAERQAHLDILRDYLHYPLSELQRHLYNQLIERLENHPIHGHTVLIGLASAEEYVEEISSLAHHLRDLYRPDALFILVEMRDHVQMVARSTTDAIDVGHVAESFGGGGHPRAAAGIIKDKTLDQTRDELLEMLQRETKSATTVAQIMSKGVRTLAPDDTVRHAAAMMTRYGHEGFPVVERESNQIVGILSRREIDKALRHKLEGTVISHFMTKGEFFVTPDDGIEAVQQVMVENRIGQVPVVAQPGGDLLGIVTRTDLIELWQAEDEAEPMVLNLGDQLKHTLSPELLNLIYEAGRLAEEQGDTLYSVGGFVRDLLLTRLTGDGQAQTSPRFDLDLVVEGDAIALAERLQAQYGGRIYSHRRFGTAKWLLAEPLPFAPNQPDEREWLTSLDFVTARTEFYRHPSALPEVEQSSIRQDLHRRDFTINTLALRLTPDRFGELLDFYGGQNDLEARLIRVLHSLSFVEDPTRMLRAARLLARLDFRLETRTAELLANALDLLDRVSGERITNELVLIFKERAPEQALLQLDLLEILPTIHPGLVVDDWLIERLQRLQSGLPETPWAGIRPAPVHYFGLLFFWLTGDEQERLMERLNLPTQQRVILKQTYALRSNLAPILTAEQASALYRLLAPASNAARLIVWLALNDEPVAAQLIRFQQELRDVTPLIDGRYLKTELEIPPGPIYSTILERLREARLDDQVETLADERALVKRILEGEES